MLNRLIAAALAATALLAAGIQGAVPQTSSSGPARARQESPRQVPQHSPPPTPAPSSQLFRVDSPADLSSMIEPIRASHKLPGLAVAVLTRDQLLGLGVCGVRKRGEETPIAKEDRFHLGSCTKAFTATLAALLVDIGRIKWDSTVGSVLGASTPAMDESWKSVTLEELLRHTSGAPADANPDDWKAAWACTGTPHECSKAFVDSMLSRPLPGKRGTYAYSNQGYTIAGRMLEEATGKEYETLLRERILVPLGISSAGFGAPSGTTAGQAPSGHLESGEIRDADNPSAVTAAGRLHMTISDWARFIAFHLRNGGEKSIPITPATLAKLHAPAAEMQMHPALGWMGADRPWGGHVLWHNGHNTMWYAVAWLAPEHGFAAIAACNQDGPEAAKACDEAVDAALRWYTAPKVSVISAPGGAAGIQPQMAVGADGTLHMLWYGGDPAGGDLFYAKRAPGSSDFTAPLRVNSQPGSAVAMGNDRGGHIGVAEDGTVHVAWNGSANATPKPNGGGVPMLYARLLPTKKEFEAQRNLMRSSGTLDGGGDMAVLRKGLVLVAWHALPNGAKESGEAARRVMMCRSLDNGASFTAEQAYSEKSTGACGCCALHIGGFPGDRALILYRSAQESKLRHTRLMISKPNVGSYTDVLLDPWEIASCPMTTAASATIGDSAILAWETARDIRWSVTNARGDAGAIHSIAGGGAPGVRASAPPEGPERRFPALAVDSRGRILLAWVEGMTWGKPGTLRWQILDETGTPIPLATGGGEEVPAWGVVSAVADPAGGFIIAR